MLKIRHGFGEMWRDVGSGVGCRENREKFGKSGKIWVSGWHVNVMHDAMSVQATKSGLHAEKFAEMT